MDDMTERAWWVYEVPIPNGAVIFVPANTEPEARVSLKETAYKGAAVETWPLRGSRWTSRHAIVRAALTKSVERGTK